MPKYSRVLVASMVAAVLLNWMPTPAAASDSVSYTRKGVSFGDVKADIENAIIEEGLKIDYRGNLGEMLERTGKDVGSDKPIYERAEFFMFCSARLSRAMMEADPANMAKCPFIVFAYQPAGADKEIVVGYRKLDTAGKGAEALTEINAMLDRIAKNAAGQ